MAELSPAFQFYPRDFLSSSKVMAMTMEERGVYITLLCLAWLDGSIPSDTGALANLCRTNKVRMDRMWPVVGACFVEAEGTMNRLVNPRMEVERTKQKINREKKAIAGSEGAKSRWHTHSSANGKPMAHPSGENGRPMILPMANDGSSSATASASAIKTKNPPYPPPSGGSEPPGFARFWKAYPHTSRRADPVGSLRSWKKQGCEPLADEIVAHVLACAESAQWIDGKEPMTKTYLNQRRWESPPPPKERTNVPSPNSAESRREAKRAAEFDYTGELPVIRFGGGDAGKG
jgi:uncharacterized protein YdaU (DUF1376 family)